MFCFALFTAGSVGNCSVLYSFTRSSTSPLTLTALILLEPIRAAAWHWTSLTQRVRRHQTNQPITRSKFQWLNQPVSQQGPQKKAAKRQNQESQQSRKNSTISPFLWNFHTHHHQIYFNHLISKIPSPADFVQVVFFQLCSIIFFFRNAELLDEK